MYLFVNDYTVQGYNGEILKRYLGKNLVRIISNPTEKHLLEFGYKPLDETAEPPEYDKSTQYLIKKYTEEADRIIMNYEIRKIETPKDVDKDAAADILSVTDSENGKEIDLSGAGE